MLLVIPEPTTLSLLALGVFLAGRKKEPNKTTPPIKNLKAVSKNLQPFPYFKYSELLSVGRAWRYLPVVAIDE